MTQFAGPSKTSGFEACELRAETAISRHFALGNITLRVSLSNNTQNNQTHYLKLIFSN